MAFLGDFTLGSTFDFKFTTVTTTGAPTTLAGTPVISAYLDNDTTQLTAGITLSVDFDSVTGLNNVRVVATAANGYAAATNYQLVITTGTVGGTSVVGYVVAEFSIANRSDYSVVRSGTAQGGGANSITLDAGASAVDFFYTLQTVVITGGTGAGQARQVNNYVGATKVVTTDANWATAPDNTSKFAILATRLPQLSAGTTGLVIAASAGFVTGSVGSVTGNVGGNVVGSVGSLTTNNDKTGYALSAAGSAALTEGYAADGAAATLPQLLYMLLAVLTEASVSGTTLTANKLDGSTAAATFTINDATNPTSITRAT